MSNRQQRRAEERAEKKRRAEEFRATKTSEYFTAKKKVMDRIMQQGISPEDLKANYDLGYKAAQRDMSVFYAAFFYAAAAIAAKRTFKFGIGRTVKLLEDMKLIMIEEITKEDIIERCKRETGIDIFEEGYTN